MGVAQRVGATRLQTGPSEPALRNARVCYDHLAGDVGVQLFEALQQRRVLKVADDGASLTDHGIKFFATLGVDIDALNNKNRPLCRLCLDWSVRRHHLAGALGAALLTCCFDRGWARRKPKSRIVDITPSGSRALREHFALRIR
jgi:hypothetical protein